MSSSPLARRRRLGVAVTLALATTAGLAVHMGSSGATAAAPADRAASYAPVVRHTANGPTGYRVTFKYYAPTAARVQLKGEWYLERPSALPQLASTPGNPVQTPGLTPGQWRPGDVPISFPNSTSPNWPVIDMIKGAHGVWTYTTPLPSGVFTYGFYVGCTDPAQAGCTEQPDPSNPAWVERTPQARLAAGRVTTSQVYVPSDADFRTRSLSWQGPAVGPHGSLSYVTYSSPGHVTPADRNYAVVYTPPGYDPARAEAYPTLYLNHGGGGNELDWSTQGDLANIMDNLIDTGETQPMVIVDPNAGGYPTSVNNAAYRSDLIENLIPYVEANYHVSTVAGDRAYSGLSMGGTLTNALLLNDTDQFGYYGMMSAGLPPGTSLSADQVAAIRKVSVFVGAGWQDPIFADGFVLNGVTLHTGPIREVTTLTDAGIHVATDFVNGGHEWYVWRILLKDFVTRVAFWPATTAETSS